MIDLDATWVKTTFEAEDGWEPYPAQPEALISGDPKVRIKRLRVRGAATPLFAASWLTIEPSTFRWRFYSDEAWIVTRGRLSITLDSGEVIEMEAGDTVSVLAGPDSTWEVHEPFAKFVVNASAVAPG